jgi:hypothetical protein
MQNYNKIKQSTDISQLFKIVFSKSLFRNASYLIFGTLISSFSHLPNKAISEMEIIIFIKCISNQF